MVELGADEAYAGYGWVENKGYAAPEHLDALRRARPLRAAPPVVAAARHDGR